MPIKNKHIKTLLAFLLISPMQIANATHEKPCLPSDWTCHNSFFITGGYVLYHPIFNNNSLSIAPPNEPAIHFSPQSTYPNNESALRAGFGSGLGNHTPFSYEFTFTEGFPKSKHNSELEITRARKSFAATINYTLNPESRLRFNVAGGAAVTSIYVTTTAKQQPSFSNTSNNADVDPYLGGSIAYSINSKFVIRAVQYYAFSSYNINLNGSLISLLMLNYYPGAV